MTTTLEHWLLATVIALLVGLWHASAARTPRPGSGSIADALIPRRRPRHRARRTTRRVAVARRLP